MTDAGAEFFIFAGRAFVHMDDDFKLTEYSKHYVAIEMLKAMEACWPGGLGAAMPKVADFLGYSDFFAMAARLTAAEARIIHHLAGPHGRTLYKAYKAIRA